MDVRQLRYFLGVVDHGSVHRAADALFVAQPSVSQALRTLERDLGTLLFHRTGRRLVLTASGQSLIEPARQVLRWIDLARTTVDAADGLESGRVTVASMPSQSVSPLTTLISRFTARHPLVQVAVRSAATPPEVLALLRTGDCELGLVAAGPDAAPADDMVVHPLETQRFILVAPGREQLPERRPARLVDLAGQRLIVGQPGTGMRRVADAVLAVAPGSRTVVEIEHRAAVIPLVLAGVGSAVVSESWRSFAETAGAATCDLVCDEMLEVSLAHRKGPLSPAAAAFLTVSALPEANAEQGTAGTPG